jgi:hypothetical protein
MDALTLSKGRDVRWHDPSGLAVQDPSVVLGGPGALVMRRDLVSLLNAEEMTLFWTVLAGNELHRRPQASWRRPPVGERQRVVHPQRRPNRASSRHGE